MEAACRGARGAGGVTVGLLPGDDRGAANPHVSVALATGLGELRNGLVVRVVDAVIAVGGGWGTTSEVALAVKTGVPVVGLDEWELRAGGAALGGVELASGPVEAVRTALAAADGG